MVYTYVKLPLYSFLIIIVTITILAICIAILGFYAGALGARIEQLEKRLENVEHGMAAAEEVFAQAQEIKAYILRTAKCTPRVATEVTYQILATARLEGIDPLDLAGMARVESNFNPAAIGKLGERGLIQIRPSTFSSWHAGDFSDWRATLEAGARYLASCLRRFRDLRLALAAYNAGPNRPPARILAISGRYADRVLAKRAAIAGEVAR